MKFFLPVLLLLTQLAFAQKTQLAIIPKPDRIEMGNGTFTISKNTVLLVQGEEDKKAAAFLNDYLQEYYGFTLATGKKAATNFIRLNTAATAGSSKEGYVLKVAKDGVEVTGNTPVGTFWGMQSLIQLLPVQKSASLAIPVVSIQDAPRFAYRGMHLDVARHFFPVAFVKKYIDYIALHKMNYFHWHLTEDQGWRIEIKKYPKLTSVGAYRDGTIIGQYPGTGNDSIRYGGFYTQDEVREIVQYAADRHITVIPEIEMPGHSSAALTAYPWLGCPGTGPYQVEQTWGIFDDVYCAGKDSTFVFLQNVLDEVLTLFPSKYIHIGGDESPKANWRTCPLCQKRIKEEGLHDEHELQSYFIQRIEKYLNGKGRTIIGWDEILEGGLAPNAIVMSWRGEEGGIAAAKQNHYVIMTPGSHVYLDHKQSQREDSVTIGGYTTVEKIYSYEPIPKELTAEQAKYVLGAQGNVWTEYMKNPSKVEYQIFPRMSALSEVLWTDPAKKDWSDFERRLKTQFKRYELWDAKYSKAYYDIQASINPAPAGKGVQVKMEARDPSGKLQYIQGKQSVRDYKKPVTVSESSRLVGLYYKDGELLDSLSLDVHINKATGKSIKLEEQPSDYFPGNGAITLVDGIINKKGERGMESVGYPGKDVKATIDLGTTQKVKDVVVHALRAGGTYVYPPSAVEVWGSADGTNFKRLGSTNTVTRAEGAKAVIKVDFEPVNTRYVQVLVKALPKVPEGNKGAGETTWLFLDEIEVN